MGLAAELHRQRKERYALWASKAVPDNGIDLKRKKLSSPAAKATLPAPPPVPTESIVSVVELSVQRKPTAVLVLRAVSRHYSVGIFDLKGPSRRMNICWPRQIAAYLMVTFAKLSHPQAGRQLGGKDHTTVLHAKRKVAARLLLDLQFAEEVEGLKSRIVAGHYD